MYKNKYFIILILFINLINFAKAEIIQIKVKLKNEIITNIDIENEIKYLVFLNPNLNELNKSQLNNLAKNSLINDIIKKKELKKRFDFEKTNQIVSIIEKNLLRKKNIKSKSEFIKILNDNNLDYKIINEKLKIEALWNQLIYDKYSNNVKIDETDLRQKIIISLNKTNKKYEYNLSEIMFVETEKENKEQILKKIINNFNEIGFENTANIFSISNTSKNGGLIGWVNELQLSERIRQKIENLKIGQITEPIKIQNGYLLIKINDKKEFKEKVNIEEQLKKLISKEKNRQFNSFSNILYKRLKKNIEIYEF